MSKIAKQLEALLESVSIDDRLKAELVTAFSTIETLNESSPASLTKAEVDSLYEIINEKDKTIDQLQKTISTITKKQVISLGQETSALREAEEVIKTLEDSEFTNRNLVLAETEQFLQENLVAIQSAARIDRMYEILTEFRQLAADLTPNKTGKKALTESFDESDLEDRESLVESFLDKAPSKLSRIKVKEYSQGIPATVSLAEFSTLIESFSNEVYSSAKTSHKPNNISEATQTLKNDQKEVDPSIKKYL